MSAVIRSSQAVITAVITAAAALLALGLCAAPAGAARARSADVQTTACPQPAAPGMATCAALISTASTGGTGVQATSPSGYGPAGLQAAYGLQAPTEGMRQTVAVVAAGGDPNVAADLAVYRAQYGLPPCTTGDGCLRIVSQTGGATLPPVDTGFTPQIPTDLDMISAVCPNCHILLVEANDSAITDLGASVDEAVTLGAKIVNFSYYGPEDPTETTWDAAYFDHPGVAITAAAGNNGYTGGPVNYPAASPGVIAVGGSTLERAGDTGCTPSQGGLRGWCETAWGQTTSGCAQYEPTKPAWQGATNCAGRADNDLAAVASSAASPGAPIAYYNTAAGATGWGETGGTGTAAPIIAGIYADAATPGAADSPAAYPYKHPGGSYINPGTAYPYFSGLNDITSGTTGTCASADLCTAGKGWDAPSGLGSPAATASLTPSGAQAGAIYGDQFSLCLDNYQGALADNNKIEVYGCNGVSGSQTWSAQADGTIHIGSSGYCIGVTGGETANGSKVILFHCDGATSQQWRIRSNGELLNQNSGKCLEDPSGGTTRTQLVIDTCNDSAGQQWVIPYPVPAGTGEIVSQDNTSKCADNTSGSLSAGNPIEIYSCNGGANTQTWAFAANGTIRIGSSWCMDASQVTNVLVAVMLDHCNGSSSQFWVAASDGSLYNYTDPFMGASFFPGANACLEAPSMTNGTTLLIGGCDNSASQHWKLPLP